MKTILNLAMTAGEISENPGLSNEYAFMACHFSPYGLGLENLPVNISRNTMVILNDRIPCRGHDKTFIARQLAALPCGRLLLDFARTEKPFASSLIQEILTQVSVPVAVSAGYAADFSCAVFLEPTDADQDPFAEVPKWPGREIWLDLTPGFVQYTVTKQGTVRNTGIPPDFSEKTHICESLYCHYRYKVWDNKAIFSLWRTMDDAENILRDGQKLGITLGVGLYQEWVRFHNFPPK